MRENPRKTATKALPFRYRWTAASAHNPTSRGYREGGYKSAALPTELRRPNVRQCPIPRKRPPTSLWAEIPICASRALSPHILTLVLLMGYQQFAFNRLKPAQF